MERPKIMRFRFCVYGDTVDILKIDTSAAMAAHVSIDANMKIMGAVAVDNNIIRPKFNIEQAYFEYWGT